MVSEEFPELPKSVDIGSILEQESRRGSDVQQYNRRKTMADTIMTPTMPMLMGGSGGGDGLFGGGNGSGLIGGLILGSILRNNGGLFGGGGDAGAALRSPPEQSQANMSLMAAIGAVDKSVALGTATTETSNAVQTGTLSAAVAGSTAASMTSINSLKDVVNTNAIALMQGQAATNQAVLQSQAVLGQNIMENRYELSRDISADGEKTRALIVAQNEANLNRQLAEANAALIELRSRENIVAATRGVEVNTTNNINQMQQQQQQQQQFAQLGNYIALLAQQIRSNNEAINVGSGTLTASPTNTNTNIR